MVSRADLPAAFAAVIGGAPRLLEALGRAATAASTPWPILLTGETGTGKTVLARAIHATSGRKGQFVALNCAAIPPGLIERELFGHVRGAFTGANRDAPGLFETADSGTLFLDELADLPVDAQSKLLRAIEAGLVRRVGEDRERRVDVRLIGATHLPLQERMAAGTFRQDLYYRLSSFVIDLPPLRDRVEDLPALAQHFLDEAAGPGRLLAPSTLAALKSHDWPGNLRELQSVLRQVAVAAPDSGEIPDSALPPLTAPTATRARSHDPRDERPAADWLRDLLDVSAADRTTWARFLLGFLAETGSQTISRAAVVPFLRQVRGDGPTENALRNVWNRELRPALAETGLVSDSGKLLHIDPERCEAVLAGDDVVPGRSAPEPALIEERPAATPDPRRATNLGGQQRRLIGRDDEQGKLAELLAGDTSLVTLLGPGGIGKTALARSAGRELAGRFPGGCWFVDLTSTRDADGIVSATAATLGVALTGNDGGDQLTRAIAAREAMLLIVDNFEQVVPFARETVGRWREAAPRLTVLVTSRHLLGLGGEVRFEVGPLASPGPPPPGTPPDELIRYDAVALFVERATELMPSFELTTVNADAVSEVSFRLNGIPLAIELAAARLRMMDATQLARRLGDQLTMLRSARQDLPAHQRTMRATLDWSFELLPEREQRAFLDACCFRGGFTLETAEAVMGNAGGGPDDEVVDVLQALVDKSFLRRVDTPTGARLDCYIVYREYAAERLREQHGDAALTDLRVRHARALAATGRRLWEQLRDGDAEQWRDAVDAIGAETDNLLFALEHAWDADDPALASPLTLALAGRQVELGRRARGYSWATRTYAMAGDRLDPDERGWLMLAVVDTALGAARAHDWIDELRVRTGEATDPRVRGIGSVLTAWVLIRENRLQEAEPLLESGHAELTAANAGHLIAVSLMTQTHLLNRRGRHAEALGRLTQADRIARPAGRAWLLDSLVQSRVSTLRATGEGEAAQRLVHSELAAAREAGDRAKEAHWLTMAASDCVYNRRWEEGLRYGELALAATREVASQVDERLARTMHAQNAMALGRFELALQMANEGLDTSPDRTASLGLHALRGLALGALRRFTEAAADLQVALDGLPYKTPMRVPCLRLLAICHRHAGDHASVERAAAEAQAEIDDYVQPRKWTLTWWTMAGSVFEALGEPAGLMRSGEGDD